MAHLPSKWDLLAATLVAYNLRKDARKLPALEQAIGFAYAQAEIDLIRRLIHVRTV